jgi:hypothetical protein
MRPVFTVLRTHAAVPAALAVAYAYFAVLAANNVADVGARLVVQPGADWSEWLGEFARNVVLTASLVWQALLGLLGAVLAWVVAGAAERPLVRHGLWLWGLVCAVVWGLTSAPVNSVGFFLKQVLVLLLSVSSAVVLARHAHARWLTERTAEIRPAGA